MICYKESFEHVRVSKTFMNNNLTVVCSPLSLQLVFHHRIKCSEYSGHISCVIKLESVFTYVIMRSSSSDAVKKCTHKKQSFDRRTNFCS